MIAPNKGRGSVGAKRRDIIASTQDPVETKVKVPKPIGLCERCLCTPKSNAARKTIVTLKKMVSTFINYSLQIQYINLPLCLESNHFFVTTCRLLFELSFINKELFEIGMKRITIILCMIGALLLAALQSMTLTNLPFLAQISFISLGAILAILLTVSIVNKNPKGYAGTTLFFSLSLLNVVYLYISTENQALFLLSLLISMIGLLCAFFSLDLLKRKVMQKQEERKKTITFSQEEQTPILEVVDVPNSKLLEEKPLVSQEPFKRVYVRTTATEGTETKKVQKKKINKRKKQVRKQRKTKKKTVKKKVRYPQYSLITLEGIGRVKAKKLRQAKIRNTASLLKKGATKEGRKSIAKKSGFQEKQITHWVNMCDVLRVKGIGEEYSELIVLSGARNVPELAKRNPEKLLQQMGQVNKKKRLVRTLPSLNKVIAWVKSAKKMPSVLSY